MVEVSSNEMIGQYVGQTVPKVKKQMEAALGKVLFIDEAYRLSGSHFGTEAVEEIIASLTHPKFEKKLVVILAGYSDEMEDLMEVNKGLRSRFAEVLEFPPLNLEDSLKLLSIHLIQKCFVSLDYGRWKEVITHGMQYLISSSHWANGRDIKTLSQKIHNAALKAHEGGPLVTIRLYSILEEMKGMMQRGQVPKFNRQVRQQLLPEQARTASNSPITTSTSTKTTLKPPKRKRELLDLSEPQSKKAKWEAAPKDTETPHEDWKELQEKKNEEKRIQDDKDREEKRKQREEEKKRRKEKKKREKEEREREREEAKKREEQQKIQDEQRRQEQRRQEKLLQDQKRKDQQAQEKIRTMGRCVRGFAWNKVNGGWQCQGGSHFASDKELGL